MVRFGIPEYWHFSDYQKDQLDPYSRIEQLTILDDEIVCKALIPRYQGDLEANEWPLLERYYSELFADFIIERAGGITDTRPVERHREEFNEFRHHVIDLNELLPRGRSNSVTSISRPAERILLKQLRRDRYDPSALDITHIHRGGGLYLLELFVTAAQQDSVTNEDLLGTLLREARQLDGLEKDDARRVLSHPVLMVSLWENQEMGLERWLDEGSEGILEMATATGKTVAGIAAIAHVCGDLPDHPDQTPATDDARILVVAHSNAILSQWEREIRDKLGLAGSGATTGGQPEPIKFATGQVGFYTAHSLLPRYTRELADEYDLVIYDEVHHYSNEGGFGQAIQRPKYKRAMGLSATVGDDDGLKRAQLEELLAPVVYTYDLQDATRDGIIPDFDWTVHPTALDPAEQNEWEETTESIRNQFKHIRYDDETKQILRRLSVPFVEMADLGDFIQAHKAAELELDSDEVPDSWGRLQGSIQSRNWIRHRSQPKLDGAIELATEYLTGVDRGVKLVMFAMDIETTQRIGSALKDVSDNVFVVHSKVASSNKKKDRIVQERIDKFAEADHGVLIAPKLLDEGIDVPDAEVGINVAGTKTKLQLVQRMGRVLRRHGDQRPHFHHYVAVPEEHHIEGLDSKQYVQELNWVRELGEKIGQQPLIEEAHVDAAVLERAEQRGHELWARDLLADLEVETVEGSLDLEELITDITAEAGQMLLESVSLEEDSIRKGEWQATMDSLRAEQVLSIDALQRVWWLFPLYREQPAELEELLTAIIKRRAEETAPTREESQNSLSSSPDEHKSEKRAAADGGNATTESDESSKGGLIDQLKRRVGRFK